MDAHATKLTANQLARLDRLIAADRRFFQHYKGRHYRVRLAHQVELVCLEITRGWPLAALAPECCWWSIVLWDSVGKHLRVVPNCALDATTDLDEPTARAAFRLPPVRRRRTRS